MRPGEGSTAEMGTGWAAGGAPGGRRRLGEVLVAGQVLTEAPLDEAQIARALSDQLGLPFLDLGGIPLPDETLAVLPRNVIEHPA